MHTVNLVIHQQIQFVLTVDIGQAFQLRLKDFRGFGAGDKCQLLHRVQGIIVQIDFRAGITFPAAPADIAVYHKKYISRFIHLENFKFVPAEKGTLILSVWIIKRK